MSTERERKGGGGWILLAFVVILLAAGAAYYFLVFNKKPAAPVAALPAAATPTPRPAVPAPTVGYSSVTEQSYITQADTAWMAQQQPKEQALREALLAYNAAGGPSPRGLTSKESLTARRDLAAKALAANDDFAAFATTRDALYHDLLTKTPLTSADVEETYKGYVEKAKTPAFIKIREAQHALLQSGDDMLAALAKGYGNWTVSPAGKLAFKRPADGSEYNAPAAKYNANVQALNKQQQDFRGTANELDNASTAAPTGTSTAPAAPGAAASPAASASPAPAVSPATAVPPATP